MNAHWEIKALLAALEMDEAVTPMMVICVDNLYYNWYK